MCTCTYRQTDMVAGHISTHAKMLSDRVGGWVGGNVNQPSREADRQAESWQQSAAQQC